MKTKKTRFITVDQRAAALVERRNLKMARSAHAYVRGNTAKFYAWLDSAPGAAIPRGPAVWICALAERMMDRAVFIRELLPQDLKFGIERLTPGEATRVARYLAMVVGKAHARQMSAGVREKWQKELQKHRTKTLDAPSWLWSSVVELVVSHEGAYLEHCRRYASTAAA